jgi:hypothetical protein
MGAGTGRHAAIFGVGIRMIILLFAILAITISGEARILIREIRQSAAAQAIAPKAGRAAEPNPMSRH